MEGAIPKNALISKTQANDIGMKKAIGFLAEMLADNSLHEWQVKRPRTNPEILISRYEQVLV